MAMIDDCKQDWKLCEGLRLTVYDDATGKPVTKGRTLIGHPTIGYGRALDLDGLSLTECDFILDNDMEGAIAWASMNLKWFFALAPIRQRVIVNLVAHLGRTGFLKFVNFIDATISEDYKKGALELLHSEAALKAPNRFAWLALMWSTGEYQQYE